MSNQGPLRHLDIPLNRDVFLRSLIRELAGTLEDVVGYKEAVGYISIVGQNIGGWLNSIYKEALGVKLLDRQQVRDVLVDLKQRIEGSFAVAEEEEGKIVLTNLQCPFEDKVLDRPSMCMMTSNVFGTITADNLGYAKVILKKTIACRDECCDVVVYIKPTPESEAAEGREYFGLTDAPVS